MFGESSFPCPPHKDPALDTLVHGGLGRGSGKGTGHVPTTPRPPERIALFCLLLDSVTLGNPSPSTPQRSPPVSDPAPRTRSLHRTRVAPPTEPAPTSRPDPDPSAPPLAFVRRQEAGPAPPGGRPGPGPRQAPGSVRELGDLRPPWPPSPARPLVEPGAGGGCPGGGLRRSGEAPAPPRACPGGEQNDRQPGRVGAPPERSVERQRRQK